MIFAKPLLPQMSIMRSVSPAALRAGSPAMSEISVGSPSPPPAVGIKIPLDIQHGTAFRPLNMKRARQRSPSPAEHLENDKNVQPPRRKSCAERVKSFSIADILGKKEEPEASASSSANCPTSISNPATSALQINPLLLNERLQPPPAIMTSIPITAEARQAIPIPWDPLARGVAPLHLRPFFPPALLHYEQRLAWDYQRQLQEHFQAQAQILRQMSMDPGIIPSEDGSERSHSSSNGSECCSPEVDVSSASPTSLAVDEAENKETKKEDSKQTSDGNSKKSTSSDNPLNALFQLSTKNFDEEQGM